MLTTMVQYHSDLVSYYLRPLVFYIHEIIIEILCRQPGNYQAFIGYAPIYALPIGILPG